MNLLSIISTDARPALSVVAYQADQVRTWEHWRANFEALCAQLRSHPTGCWGLYFQDSYDFSIALFALWTTQRTPLLAPDASAATLTSLHTQVDGLLGDLPGALSWQSCEHPPVADKVPYAPASALHLALATSGSTGDALIIDKTQPQIETELHMQADLWRDKFADAVVAATISHQHIYGLLFKILLPLLLQRPFIAELLPNPRSLLQSIQGFPRAVWLASPAQLKRINSDMLAGLDVSPVKLIISSGGLLTTPDAAVIETIFAAPAVEIYGSTETGGIAYRQQWAAKSDNFWQPLPQVEIKISGQGALQVTSPFAGKDLATTGDLATLQNDGLFSLAGRTDNIVKLEEKRISLSAVERQLELATEVTAARVLVLDGPRQVLAAVVVLNPAGNAQLQQAGRASLTRQLRAGLAQQLEKTAIPRRFRFVEEMPMNAQGKTRMADLAILFERNPRKVLPVVQSVERSGNKLVLILWVPEDLDYFPGHFPQYPVLPGVTQLLWVRHFAKLHLDFSGSVRRMSQVKFKSMVRPGTTLTMTLKFDPEEEKLHYSIANADSVSASGIMMARPEDE